MMMPVLVRVMPSLSVVLFIMVLFIVMLYLGLLFVMTLYLRLLFVMTLCPGLLFVATLCLRLLFVMTLCLGLLFVVTLCLGLLCLLTLFHVPAAGFLFILLFITGFVYFLTLIGITILRLPVFLPHSLLILLFIFLRRSLVLTSPDLLRLLSSLTMRGRKRNAGNIQRKCCSQCHTHYFCFCSHIYLPLASWA